jgi:hypothetical protein
MSEDFASGPVLKASHFWAMLGSRLGATDECDKGGIGVGLAAKDVGSLGAVIWLDGVVLPHAPAIKANAKSRDTPRRIIVALHFETGSTTTLDLFSRFLACWHRCGCGHAERRCDRNHPFSVVVNDGTVAGYADERLAPIGDVDRILRDASAAMLVEAREDVTAFTAFPVSHWRKIWSTNPLERVTKEIRRRTDVVGILPNEPAILRLAGAVLLEVHDEWAIAERRYLSEGSMARLDPAGDDGLTKEVERARTVLLAS